MKRYELMFTHLSPNKHEEGRWDIHEYENGCYVKYNDHLAAMKELTNEVRLLTDRLAQVVKERDELKREITEVANVAHWGGRIGHSQDSALNEIRKVTIKRFSKSNPFDPSAEQRGGK